MRRLLLASALALPLPAAAIAQTAAGPVWSGSLPASLAQANVEPAWSGPLPPATPEPAWSGPVPAPADEPTIAKAEPGGLLEAESVPPSIVEPEQAAPSPAASAVQTAATPLSGPPPVMAGAPVRLGADYYVGNPAQLAAAEPPARMPNFLRGTEAEVGTRYFWSTGTMLVSLKNVSNTQPVSRLTFSDMKANSGEVFGRVEIPAGLFGKAVVGAGDSDEGNLKDEDFPPGITPYSATNSSLHGGSLEYATADLGWDLLALADWQARADQALGSQKAHFGPFVGYAYYHEQANAYGCTQIASNRSVCTPTISSSVEVISQKDDWSALRIGLSADATFFDRLTIGVDGAWLPWGSFTGYDTHLLRIGSSNGSFNGPIPETGDVHGFQTELTLAYRVTDHFRLNVGARYWFFGSSATAHFDQAVIPVGSSSPQAETRRDNRYGAFIGGSWTF
jgi:hypothetical protein